MYEEETRCSGVSPLCHKAFSGFMSDKKLSSKKKITSSQKEQRYIVLFWLVCVFVGVVQVRALGIVASVSNNIKEIWRPVDMILLQATDNNRYGTLPLAYPHSEHVHHSRAYNNIAVITKQEKKKAFCVYMLAFTII